MKKLAVIMTGVALVFAGCGEEPTEQWEQEIDEAIEYFDNDAKEQEEAYQQQTREDEQKIQDGMSELELLDEKIKEGR
jgi:hypothetical protein